MDLKDMGAPQGAARVTPEIIKSAKLLECGCGGKMWENRMIIKKISPILSPTGKEEFFPMNILVCASCGLVPQDLNPDGMIPNEFIRKEDSN